MIHLTHAMVLAAGLGTRMRPLTDTRPKPLVELEGRSLLHHALDRIRDAGIGQAVVNAHWFPDQIEAAAAAYPPPPRVVALREEVLLETGGGVTNALPRLGDQPFAVVNGDAFWLDGPTPALRRLAAAFDPAEMDALLLMVRTSQVEGETGAATSCSTRWAAPAGCGSASWRPTSSAACRSFPPRSSAAWRWSASA
jgi:MurNAc alpha-1-phosphate uridylyltransferase